MAEFAVIGLGRFGRAVVHHLALGGQEVVAVDRDPERLKSVEEDAESTLCMDTTEEDALSSLPLGRLSTVVVTIGSRAPEASLLTVTILKELEVPRIVARAFGPRHARLLRELGAHEILNPEDAMARRLSLQLSHPGISDQIRWGDVTVGDVELPEAFVGSTVEQLELYSRYGVRILAIRHRGGTTVDPPPELRVESSDRAILMGPSEALERIASLA